MSGGHKYKTEWSIARALKWLIFTVTKLALHKKLRDALDRGEVEQVLAGSWQVLQVTQNCFF